MKLIHSLLVVGALALVSCSHGTMRGSVAMKTAEDEAHVCLGNNEVKVGDKLIAYFNSCPGGRGGKSFDGVGRCEKKKLGTGTITELLNEHYSVAKFDGNFKLDEGTFVEKQ